MDQMTPFWNRRRLLATGLGGAGFATLGGLPISAWAQSVDPRLAGKILNLVIRYRTDADRIARVLPPGIEPDEVADVMLDWWVRYPTPGSENIYYPGVYSECGVHVTAKYQGRRGMFQVGMPLDQEWGRSAGRETVGLVKKDGVVAIARDGDEITADLHRRGKLIYRIKTKVLARPAHPLYWHRETGFGAFLYRYRLNPNWEQGPLSADPVELWLRVLAGKRGAYPEAMTPGGPRECDFAATEFEFVDPSVLDPFCEFPMRRIVGMSYSETGFPPTEGMGGQPAAAPPRTPTRVERLQFVDSKAFEPWALMNYDRPITAGQAWTPTGWPARATALKLTPPELQRYRERVTLNLDLQEALDFQLEVHPAVHARTLPPPLQAGARPLIRVLALKTGKSDISTEPFTELWLFSRCEHEGAEAWYALGHTVGPGGDVVYGRETFGYPSKTGTIAWSADGALRTLSAQRMTRTFARIACPATPPTGGANTAQIRVVALRTNPPYRAMTLTGFTEPGPQADLVSQPWALELTAASALDPALCRLEFPAAAGPGRIGANDPWFELAGGRVVEARVGRGVLRRSPGRRIAVMEDYQAYYLERMDGTTDSNEAVAGGPKPSFLARK